jgi:amidase
MAVSGPIGRTIQDLRVALAAMSARDTRDPWWVPAPLEGPPMPKRVALCLRPDGLAIVPAVEAALRDAAKRLEAAGWKVEEIDDTPSLSEATDLQIKLWLGDGFAGFAEAVTREGDPGALAVLEGVRARAEALPKDVVAQALLRRVTLTREWLLFLDRYPVLLLPVSAELPFKHGADLGGQANFDAVWRAQLVQTGLPLMGLPGLTVSTGMVGTAPMGVQLIAGRYREDLCLAAGEAIEACGVPISPIDPVW